MDKEKLIQELDGAYDLVYAEYGLVLSGHSGKKASQLSFIMRELQNMRRE